MKMPSAWVRANTQKKKPVMSGLDMSAEVAGSGKCPECKKLMQKAMLDDNEIWVCNDHRIALPVKD